MLPEETRILVVDDQEEMREVLSDMLASEGYESNAVPGARQALEELAARRYDLVLTDLNMPGMDGLALLSAIHRSSPALPVVVITGYGSRSTERRVLREGASGYISKPCTMARVIGTVREALESSGPA